MKIRRLMFVGVLSFAMGVWLIFNYCHGSTGFTAGDSLSAWAIKLDITTEGWPTIVGVPLTMLGSLLLLIAIISTVVAEIRYYLSKRKPKSQPSLSNRKTTPPPEPLAPRK